MKKMYRGVTNSPKTELVALITETDTEIEVNDISVLLPNEGVAVIGNGDVAETIRYLEVEGNVLKGCIRGYEGIARSWTAGTRVARNFAASDWNTAIDNITGLYGRLNTADTDAVTLQPGLQVVKAAKDSRFRLGQIKGKTEINGQGRIGIIGVENPYVICTSDNLLPPFYESWDASANASLSLISDYEIILKTTGTAQEFIHFPSYPVLKNTTYTFSAEHNAGLNVHAPGKGTIASNVKAGFVTFNTGDATAINIGFVDGGASGGVAGEYTIKKPMLVVGSEPKPFQPQRKSMLAFQTKLHANPKDGSDPDILFEQGGEYRKLAKWKKVVLDGKMNWALNSDSQYLLYKKVYTTIQDITATSITVTKYTGETLTAGVVTDYGGDHYFINTTNKAFEISIFNSNSGWGDDYNPTQDEIKAYFMGWKMCDITDASGKTPYNGTGTKGWFWVGDPASTKSFTTTLPTSYNGGTYGWRPYNLLYRLAKDSVEPVSSEGCLTLAEGVNLVEVGTGIVLREHAPLLEVPGSGAAMGDMSAPTKFKIEHFLTAYKNNRPDYKWYHVAGNAYGLDKARIMWEDYDKSAVYTLTYLKLDKSPIQPITGSLATTEKAQLVDLTAGVAEALQRVGDVEQKKAEKDSPIWIKPTLLNGWTVNTEVAFRKDSQGMVHLRGILTPGVSGVHMFILPAGYRPKSSGNQVGRNMAGVMYSPTAGVQPALIVINLDGSVYAVFDHTANWVSIDGISFSVE